MRGSIVKRGAGYSYVLYLGRGEDGRKQQKWVGGFRTKRSAEDALGEALGRISAGQFSDPGRITVGEFLDQWIDAISSGLRASTAASYRMLLFKRVIPRIGSIRLASLTPGHLTKLYATLLAEGGRGAHLYPHVPFATPTPSWVRRLATQSTGDCWRGTQFGLRNLPGW
jgi:hypothetical protein